MTIQDHPGEQATDYKTTDYCVRCGESPDSGSHLPHGHEYVPPVYYAEAAAYRNGWNAALAALSTKDQNPDAEIEASAAFVPSNLESDDLYDYPIRVSPMTGAREDDFLVGVAGAESLIAQLLRAAAAARKALGATTEKP